MISIQNIIDYGFALLLLIWWVCSCISQYNEKIRKIFGQGILHLIPNYRFFAPVPIRRDFHLEYRLIKPSLKTTEWKRISFFSERTVLSVLWYPDKRTRKSFNTYVRRIIKLQHSQSPRAIPRSISYRHLLNYLQDKNNDVNSRGMQFKIVSEQTFDTASKPRLVLISDWHFQIKKENHEV